MKLKNTIFEEKKLDCHSNLSQTEFNVILLHIILYKKLSHIQEKLFLTNKFVLEFSFKH